MRSERRKYEVLSNIIFIEFGYFYFPPGVYP